jgi:hypothetical protein
MHKGISFVREHGFLFSVFRVGSEGESAARKWLEEPAFDSMPLVPAFDIDPAAIYNLGFVVAPVVDARDKVAFVIAMQGFQKPCTGADIRRIGARVLEACERISSFMVAPGSQA